MTGNDISGITAPVFHSLKEIAVVAETDPEPWKGPHEIVIHGAAVFHRGRVTGMNFRQRKALKAWNFGFRGTVEFYAQIFLAELVNGVQRSAGTSSAQNQTVPLSLQKNFIGFQFGEIDFREEFPDVFGLSQQKRRGRGWERIHDLRGFTGRAGEKNLKFPRGIAFRREGVKGQNYGIKAFFFRQRRIFLFAECQLASDFRRDRLGKKLIAERRQVQTVPEDRRVHFLFAAEQGGGHIQISDFSRGLERVGSFLQSGVHCLDRVISLARKHSEQKNPGVRQFLADDPEQVVHSLGNLLRRSDRSLMQMIGPDQQNDHTRTASQLFAFRDPVQHILNGVAADAEIECAHRLEVFIPDFQSAGKAVGGREFPELGDGVAQEHHGNILFFRGKLRESLVGSGGPVGAVFRPLHIQRRGNIIDIEIADRCLRVLPKKDTGSGGSGNLPVVIRFDGNIRSGEGAFRFDFCRGSCLKYLFARGIEELDQKSDVSGSFRFQFEFEEGAGNDFEPGRFLIEAVIFRADFDGIFQRSESPIDAVSLSPVLRKRSGRGGFKRSVELDRNGEKRQCQRVQQREKSSGFHGNKSFV
ncbi:MAG: hypothetical protein BWY31_04475 [Lentisphaerae bacterium ADurb.Bin242]|nr:MAG: hypothetical protein BWY31_04475 [Lentisphaerae bacterium ADurb.Bin242]